MRRILLFASLLIASLLHAQLTPGQPISGPANVAGILYASTFGQWNVAQGNNGPFNWTSPTQCVANAGGVAMTPVFKVGTPIMIVDANPALNEIVTPTTVVYGPRGCSIQVVPIYNHNSFYLKSATAGLQEAINWTNGLAYQVDLTTDWTRLGGQDSMITAAKGYTPVQILDNRTAALCSWAWSGSAYVSQGCQANGASLTDTSLQTFAGPLAVPMGITAPITGHASLDLPLTGGTLTGPLTGTSASFPGGVTANVTGSASLNVLKAGDTMTGVLNNSSGFVGPLTGTVTGAASLNVLKAGDSMTGPLAMTGNGVYTGSTFNSNLGALMDSCNPSTEFTFTNGRPDGYSALLGCVNVPSGSTILQSSGVAGMAIGNPGGSSTNVVGVYGSGVVKSGSGWGGNFLASSVNTSGPGTFLWGIEDDLNINNVNDIGKGFDLIGFWNAQPTTGVAVDVEEPLAGTGGPYKWPIGLQFETQATGTAINFNPENQAASQPSQKIVFNSFNGSTSLLTGSQWLDSGGGMLWTFGPNTDRFGPDGSITAMFNGGTSTFQFVSGFEPGLSATNSVGMQVGVATSANNSAIFGFNNAGGTGSTSNFAYMGTVVGKTVNVDSNGNATINGNLNITGSCTGCGGGGGSGTVTSVATGAGLTGGPITTTGTISIPNSGVTNAMLANPATTVNGQSCALGGTCTVTSTSSAWPGHIYYLGASGADTNAGTFAAPWLTPNHPVNCGDTIIALPSSSYAASNFASGKWGTVTCTSGNAVAWLQCQTFDGCLINAGSNGGGILVSASYWGVQGWEVRNGGASGAPCFAATPPTTGANIHHIIFANNVGNGCGAAGISFYNNGAASFDYAVVIGNIVYNATQNNTHCYSGLDFYQPVATDTNAGTHIFVAGNFSFGNLNPNPCNGTVPTNGDGLIFDTFDGCPPGGGCPGGTSVIYTQQTVAENNMLVDNGSSAYEYQTYTKGNPAHPTVIFQNNTGWGNNQDGNINTNLCSDAKINIGYGILVSKNIDQTTASTSCTSHTLYAFYAYDANAANVAITGNLFDATSGSATGNFNDDGNTAPSFAGNTTGVSPSFAGATNPSSPSCSGTVNVPGCMATVIANFTPSASAALGLGYQTVANSTGADPYFPQWLCRIGIPEGLIKKSCI